MPKHTRQILGLIVFVVGLTLLINFLVVNTHISAPQTASHNQTATPPVMQSADATCYMRGQLPDPVCTPGAVNPAVTQDNLPQTICRSGYTKTVRPPVSYTNKLKAEQMRAYGFTDDIRNHEEDHLVPLEVGGAPSDPKNLWPEPGNSPNAKDNIENLLHDAVCSGRISLQAAQQRIMDNWVTAADNLP